MSKNSYRLDKGFLLNYAQQVPILEDFERENDYSSIGMLVMNAIRRQRDGIDFPETNNRFMRVAQIIFDAAIKDRLNGAKRKEENTGTVPPSVPPSDHKKSKEKKSKVKKSKVKKILSPPIIPLLKEGDNNNDNNGMKESSACAREDEERYSNIEFDIVSHFVKKQYISFPEDFIAYNKSRNWRGIGGEDIREDFERYAEKWENEERRKQGYPTLASLDSL